MTQIPRATKALNIGNSEAKSRLDGPSELYGVVTDAPILIECEFVDAVCTEIRKIKFGAFGLRLVFKFTIVSPRKFEGKSLEMYVRFNPDWKGVPRSSKLAKSAVVATGGWSKRLAITHALFKNKLFKCKLRLVGKGPARYSVVDAIQEKLTG